MALWPKGALGFIRCGQAYYRRIGGEFNLIERNPWTDTPCRVEAEQKHSVEVILKSGERVLVDKLGVQLY